jgi:hypothetical protein
MGFDVGGIALTSPGDGTFVVTGAAPWMRVNTSGILTRPQMPFMRGQMSGKGGAYNAGGAPLKVTADVNGGSCWNDATGLFTAPVAGYYLATAGNIAGQQAAYLYLRKNGGDIHFVHWNHVAVWHYVTLSAIASLAAGDYLSWHVTGRTPDTAGFYGDGGHCMYSIALMA